MKKSFNVKLGEVAFCIDEDALEFLESYMKKVAAHFECKGENLKVVETENVIAAKLQNRVGANGIVTKEVLRVVLDELEFPFGAADCDAQKGESIAKETPKESAAVSDNSSEDRDEAQWRAAMLLGNKLFRDPYDYYLGGVLSGVAKKYWWDVTLTRVLFVLLFFVTLIMNGWGALLLIAYCIAWAAVPKARSIIDITRMRKPRAKKYSATAIEDAWRDNHNIAMAELAAPKTNGCLAGFIRVIFFLLLFLLGLPLLFALAVALFVIVVLIFALFSVFGTAIFNSIYVVILILLPLFAVVHWFLKKCGVCRPLNIYIKLTIILGWLVTLVLAGYKINAFVENNGGWKSLQQKIVDKRFLDEDFWEEFIEQSQSTGYTAWDNANLPFVIDARISDSSNGGYALFMRFIDRDSWTDIGDTENMLFDASTLSLSHWDDNVGDIHFLWDSVANEILVNMASSTASSVNLYSRSDAVQLRYATDADVHSDKGMLPFEIVLRQNGRPQLFIGGNDTIDGLFVTPIATRYIVNKNFNISFDDSDSEEKSDTLE